MVEPSLSKDIKSFLTMLDGCSEQDATNIYYILGDETLKLLDEDITLANKSIKNASNFSRFNISYQLHRTKREIYTYLLSLKIPCEIAQNVSLAADSLEQVQTNPFYFAVNSSLSFSQAKVIASKNNVHLETLIGAEAAIIDVLRQSEGAVSGHSFDDCVSGNTYCEIETLYEKSAKLIGTTGDSSIIRDSLVACEDENLVTVYDNTFVYLANTGKAEYGISDEIARISSVQIAPHDFKLDIYALENKKAIRLAPEQRNAVKVVLKSAFSLLIGGPGTGKTTIEQMIIDIFKKYHPGEKVLLVAPTGKAARRMSESTGEPACTIHKALGLLPSDPFPDTIEPLDAGLIVVDEVSMIDNQVGYAFLKACKTGTQVVFVGDTNQLPSVGSGNVLYELIESKVLPIAALETVYRQKAGSTIAINCARIKNGSNSLEYTDDFVFVEAKDDKDAAAKAVELYNGYLSDGINIDDICLLSPYRKNTETGLNQLNPIIQDAVIEDKSHSIKYGERKQFFIGDKVMCMVNMDDVSNGDVGHVIKFDTHNFTVDFGDGRIKEFKKSEMKNFELAYGITIHKSQGSEFKVCIIIMMDSHRTMLKRNLLYTAVSRAKQKVVIVGTQSALDLAIKTEDVTKRHSRLAEILKNKYANVE
jgi:exodeoxyribonuclease V alpha subunit